MELVMSFEVLLKKISSTLRRITYRLNGHFTFFNDEDLYQEALVHLWQDFCAGRLENKTDSYILQGCYFHLQNYIRKAKIWNIPVSLEAIINKEGVNLEESLFLKSEDAQSYYDDLNNRMLVDTIRNNGLTPREKNILSLYAEGLTTREIGKRIGVSHVRVVKLMGRIREKCSKYRGGF
jgi:RNA polymerase sigma factor (sigma-70 family)